MSDNPYQAVENPVGGPQRKSRTLLWVILGAFTLMSLLCCCGGPMLLTWGVGSRINTDPAKVTAEADAMLEMDRPAELKPMFYMDVFVMKMVCFGDENGDMLCQMELKAEYAKDREAMRAAMDEQMQKQAADNPELPELVVDEQVEREYQVRGEPVTFDLSKCTAVETGERYYRVSGVIDSPDGSRAVMVVLQVKEENFSEDRIAEMIESIR
ncbi:MAG TPA: hypothetical protein DCY79_05570 [Planctomycetaceae bacterium]|nr:hypothetical protein [Blastopirellula sp.]HAY79259.1 hypothetical protein [Planctomycetaceae bacterium]